MVAADHASNYARKLGIQRDQLIQEWGWDEDTDDDIRAAIEEACGGELLDEDTDEVIDVVLLWWRDGDGDLVDTRDGCDRPARRGRCDLGGDAQDRPARPCIARRDCRGGAHSWADADLVGQSGQLERQQIGTAEIAGWQALMLNVGATAPDFTLRDQNQQLVTLRG